MNEQDDTQLWQLMGRASQASPGEGFARNVMARIAAEPQTAPVAVESIHGFRRHTFRLWAASAAALVAGVIGVISLLDVPATPEAGQLMPIASLNIDDVLVEEAGQSLGQENLMDALCVLASTETGVISSDSIQDLLL